MLEFACELLDFASKIHLSTETYTNTIFEIVCMGEMF